MDGAVGSPRSAEDVKLQLLQLQCIIDAKDREIHLLRKQLTSQEEADEIAALHAEVAQLRKEVHQLTLERNALRQSFAGAAGASPRGSAPPVAAPSAVGSEAANGVQQRIMPASGSGLHGGGNLPSSPHVGAGGTGPGHAANPAEGRSYPVSPAFGGSVDPSALVEKLRSLVTSLVAEALAAQHRHAGQSPTGPSSSKHFQPQAASAASPPPNANTLGKLPDYPSVAPLGPFPRDAEQQPSASRQETAPAQVRASLAQPGIASKYITSISSQRPGVPIACPGVHIIVQQVPPLPSSTLAPVVVAADTLPDSSSSPGVPVAAPAAKSGAAGTTSLVPLPSLPENLTGSRNAAEQVAGMSSGGATVVNVAAAPAVLELNVDGAVMLVERAVLDSQTAGSSLHRKLVSEYGNLPLDSHGRPYLSYDPRVFQVLLSHLKERYLFGSAAASSLASLAHAAESSGVSRHYFAQVASHFGLAILPTLEQPAAAVAAAAAGPSSHTPFSSGQPSLSMAAQAAPPAVPHSLTIQTSSSIITSLGASQQHVLPAAMVATTSRPTTNQHEPFEALPGHGPRQAQLATQPESGAPPMGVLSAELDGQQPWGQLPSLRVSARPDGPTGGGAISSGFWPAAGGTVGTEATPPSVLNGTASGPAEPGAALLNVATAESAAVNLAGAGAAAGTAGERVEHVSNGPAFAGGAASLSESGVASTPGLQAFDSVPQPQPPTQSQQATASCRPTPSVPSPSRIPPPPPPSQKPAAALSAAPATSIPAQATSPAAAAAAGSPPGAPEQTMTLAAPAAGTAAPDSTVPGWWQPFSDGAIADAGAAPVAGIDRAGPASLPSAAPAPSVEAVLPAPVAPTAATGRQQAPLGVATPAPGSGPPPTVTGSDDVAAASAALAAAEARYKVPNLYAVLAEKRRADLEAEGTTGV